MARLAGIPHEIVNVAQQAGMKLEGKLQVCISKFENCVLEHIEAAFEKCPRNVFYTDLSMATEFFPFSQPSAGRFQQEAQDAFEDRRAATSA